MFQSRPNPELEKSDLKFLKRLDRIEQKEINRGRRRGRKWLAGTALMVTVVHPLAAYTSDAYYNYVDATHAVMDIDSMGDPLDESNSDSGLVILNGLGTNNADMIAETKGAAFQQLVDGEIWSVDYNNAPIDIPTVTDRIGNMTGNQELEQVSFFGWSAGGNISVGTAEDIILNTDTEVPLITLVMTPDGISGLTEASQQGIDAVELFSKIPGARYSSYLRTTLEVGARFNNYSSGDLSERWTNFWDTVHIVQRNLAKKQLPEGQVVVNQALAIAGVDIRQSFKNIAEAGPQELRPVIVYLAVGEGGSDPIVDNEYSSEKICEYAAEAGLQCFVYNVPNADHNYPNRASEEFLQTLTAAAPEVQAAIAQEALSHQIRNTRFKNLFDPVGPIEETR